ncbi:unnamed protein product [Chironomus riparius]|uniref:Uncharacterized protein n=1 Tax=Chironomus riparius TaxID=315576 RepID=A0A9N9RVQ5_9DIPT|nr:unnamed protein product [Chironomus riparius]
MTFTLPKKFLCCLPLETGSFIIGGFSIAVGILCLNFFIVAVPYAGVNIHDKLLLTAYYFFVIIAHIFCVSLIISGYFLILGVYELNHRRMIPLMMTFIAQPFMGIVIFVLYFESAYIHSHIAVFYIYTIFTFLTAYFLLCIKSLYEVIRSRGEKPIAQRLPSQGV